MHRGTKAALSILALLIAAVAVLAVPVSATHAPALTIMTDTTLSADFTGAIGIAADGVTLDCAGHTVMGPGVGFIFHPSGEPFVTIGILLEGRTNVTIKNCHVTGFGWGFALDGSDGNTLQGNTADGNIFEGFDLRASNGNTLTDNTANDINDIAHGSGGGTGFGLSLSFENTLQNNTANGGGTGFGVTDSYLISLEGNTANNNTRNGFFVGWSYLNTLSGNTANGNGEDGFGLFKSSGNTLTGNAACDNGEFDAIQDRTSTENEWHENDFCNPLGIRTPVASLFGVSPWLIGPIVAAGVGVLLAVFVLARRGRSR